MKRLNLGITVGRRIFLTQGPFVSIPSPPSRFSTAASTRDPPVIIPDTRSAPSSSSTSYSSEESALSAYIHVPFCKRKCHYCDFAVRAVGMNAEKDHVIMSMEKYVDTLCREITATRRVNMDPLQTIYIGGGTPSLLPPKLLGRVLDTVRSHLTISPDAEITLEADPGTFDAPRLDEFLALGVNRLSVGVQSFQEHHLVACGRAHGLAEVESAIQIIHRAGVPTWSLDLISGLPNLTMAEWEASLARAADAGAPHLSVYDLQLEEGTPFGRWYEAEKGPMPTDDLAADMYRSAAQRLSAAGFEHYEVSNYARPGHRSRHNQVYWEMRPFYGFGQGAASYLFGRRFSRTKDYKKYQLWATSFAIATELKTPGEGTGIPGFHSMPEESREDRLLDLIMVRLRTSDGLHLGEIGTKYGADVSARVVQALAPHEAEGLVEFTPLHQGESTKREEGRVRLTDPNGFLVSNGLISDIFALF